MNTAFQQDGTTTCDKFPSDQSVSTDFVDDKITADQPAEAADLSQDRSAIHDLVKTTLSFWDDSIPRSNLEFGVLDSGCHVPRGGPVEEGITVIVSCRSTGTDQGYIYRGDLWPGMGFGGEEGKKRFECHRKALASVLQESQNLTVLHSLCLSGSSKRTFLPTKQSSEPTTKTNTKAYNSETDASIDLAIVIKSIIESSGIDQPKGGFQVTTAQSEFYHWFSAFVRDPLGNISNRSKDAKFQGPWIKHKNVFSTLDTMNVQLREAFGKDLAAQWEYEGCYSQLIPLASDSLPLPMSEPPKKKAENTKKLRKRRESRPRGGKSRSPLPSHDESARNALQSKSQRSGQSARDRSDNNDPTTHPRLTAVNPAETSQGVSGTDMAGETDVSLPFGNYGCPQVTNDFYFPFPPLVPQPGVQYQFPSAATTQYLPSHFAGSPAFHQSINPDQYGWQGTYDFSDAANLYPVTADNTFQSSMTPQQYTNPSRNTHLPSRPGTQTSDHNILVTPPDLGQERFGISDGVYASLPYGDQHQVSPASGWDYAAQYGGRPHHSRPSSTAFNNTITPSFNSSENAIQEEWRDSQWRTDFSQQ